MNSEVRTYLIEVARQKDKFVYYSELVKDCGLDFNLSTEYGKHQLSVTLGDISAFEFKHGRPLISSLVIYKDERRNDQGNGFYKLAEDLGIGKFKTLKDELYGFAEAEKSRKFWQNENNYIQFAQPDNVKQKETINELFNKLIIKKPYEWLNDWHDGCLEFVIDVASLKSAIIANPNFNIDNEALYRALSNTAIQSYEGFMGKWLKERSNGIASRGQSVLSEEHFKTIIEDEEFKTIAKKVISNPSLNTYNLLTNWWYNNDDISNRPLLINRALAACCPENISTTADNRKFWETIGRLQSDCGFQFDDNPNENWYSVNEKLTAWLDKKLFSELNQISSNRLEQQIWRNIFVWLLHEEFEVLNDVKPNSLTRREKPKDGIEKIPETSRAFQGVEIDFQAKAKEQKDLGDDGEELVKQFEINYLKKQGKHEEAEKVKIVKDGVGYDILSFDANGNEKYIEVKTTTGNQYVPFFLSDNEVDFLRLHRGNYSIYRVYNYNEDYNFGEFFEIKGDIEAQLLMKATEFKVYLKKDL